MTTVFYCPICEDRERTIEHSRALSKAMHKLFTGRSVGQALPGRPRLPAVAGVAGLDRAGHRRCQPGNGRRTMPPEDTNTQLIAEQLRHALDLLKADIVGHARSRPTRRSCRPPLEDPGRANPRPRTRIRSATDGVTQFKVWFGPGRRAEAGLFLRLL